MTNRTRPLRRVFYCPNRASRVPAKCRDFCSNKKRNCSQGSPHGNAWTLLAGSVVYGKNTGSPRTHSLTVLMGGARSDRRDWCIGVPALGWSLADRWGETHATRVAQDAPSRADGQGSIPWARPNSIRYVLLRTFALAPYRASTGPFIPRTPLWPNQQAPQQA